MGWSEQVKPQGVSLRRPVKNIQYEYTGQASSVLSRKLEQYSDSQATARDGRAATDFEIQPLAYNIFCSCLWLTNWFRLQRLSLWSLLQLHVLTSWPPLEYVFFGPDLSRHY